MPEYNTIIKCILKMSENGTDVTWVLGNHDGNFREWIKDVPTLQFGNIKILNETSHIDLQGCNHLITHGDLFDGVERLAPWLSKLGAIGYDVLIMLNKLVNFSRKLVGLKYWSFSAYIKKNVKRAMMHVSNFEANLAKYAKECGYAGVICGHIHVFIIMTIGDISYMNSGDWQESVTALVEDASGNWNIIHWQLGK